MRATGYLAILLLAAVAPAADAAMSPRLRIETRVLELPEAGLKFRPLQRATARPLPPADAMLFRSRLTGETGEAFSLGQLWFQNQFMGCWQDESGNVFTLAQITHRIAKTDMQKLVAPEGYAGMIEQTASFYDWTPETLNEWVACFVGEELEKEPSELRKPFRMHKLLQFHVSGNRLAYAFQFPRISYIGTTPKWYFMLFAFNSEVDKADAEQAIVRELLPSVQPMDVRDAENREAADMFQNTNVAREGKRSPEYEASRQRVIDSIKNMKDWWYVETKNYVIVSDLKSRDRRVIQQLQADIEYLRSAFEQYMPPPEPLKAVSVVRVFATDREYEAYVMPEMKWTGGMWMPSRKELVVRPIGISTAFRRMEYLLDVVHHEAFHQYLFYAYNQLPASIWFNEGHAKFFEAADIAEQRLVIEEIPEIVEQLEKLSESPENIYLEELLAMSVRDFYSLKDGNAEKRSTNYAIAWGLVYYLRKGATLNKHNLYRDILDTYCRTLWETKDGNAATAAAFAEIDMKALKKDFTDFWRSRSKRAMARNNRIFRDFSAD